MKRTQSSSYIRALCPACNKGYIDWRNTADIDLRGETECPNCSTVHKLKPLMLKGMAKIEIGEKK